MRKLNLKFKQLAFIFISCYLLISCNSNNKQLSVALEQAGQNRNELEKVINHYQQHPKDSLKLKAAYYLIENMPRHFSYDTTNLYRYRPVTTQIRLLTANKTSFKIIKEKVNPLMDSLVSLYPLSYIYNVTKADVNVINAQYLIKNIDQAFTAYENSLFRNDILFDDFMEYIMPYRIQDGYSIEDWRSRFNTIYTSKQLREFKNIHQLVDSLLFRFKDAKYGAEIATKFPYLKISDFLASKATMCPQRCWFNCLLLRSYALPVAIDMVPVSRVNPLGHEWNTLILKDGIYPIEPFWREDGFRSLKEIYIRKVIHPAFGPIDMPKVYRKTFKQHGNELMTHAISSGEEIAPFFSNPNLIDVTQEYFNTFQIHSPIIKPIKQLKYAYACVLGTEQNWIPVDFGKVEDKSVSFNNLGSRNIYLPAYYHLGQIVPAAYPVVLHDSGDCVTLRPDLSKLKSINIREVAYRRPDEKEYEQGFLDATLEGSNDNKFKTYDVLYTFNQPVKPGIYNIKPLLRKKYRYYRFKIAIDKKVKLNECNFFYNEDGKEIEGEGRLMFSSLGSSDVKANADKNLVTASTLQSFEKSPIPVWLGYDFGKPVILNKFQFYYVHNSNIRKNGIYELLYWDFGWKSVEKLNSPSLAPLSFANVPCNALLMIKIHDTDKYSRVFTYKNGKQHWY